MMTPARMARSGLAREADHVSGLNSKSSILRAEHAEMAHQVEVLRGALKVQQADCEHKETGELESSVCKPRDSDQVMATYFGP
jgi:hypothetical protein